MVTWLTLSSLLAVGLCSIFVISWFLMAKERLQLSCESHAIQAQKHLIEGAYDLIDLNETVELLVQEKNQIEQQLLTAVGPERIPLMALLIKVRTEMGAMRARQIWILNSRELQARREMEKLSKEVERHARNLTSLWQRGSLRAHTRNPWLKIEVDAKYTDWLLPTYDFASNYKSRQRIDIQIAITGPSPFPKWFQLPLRRFEWLDSCASEPRQEEEHRWTSHLTEAKL